MPLIQYLNNNIVSSFLNDIKIVRLNIIVTFKDTKEYILLTFHLLCPINICNEFILNIYMFVCKLECKYIKCI